MAEVVPEPPPIPVPSAAIIAAAGASTARAGVACVARNAGVIILEETTRAIATEGGWIHFVIADLDELETKLAIVSKGTTVHVDNIGANTSDFHTVAFVPCGGDTSQRNVVIGSDIETISAIVVEQAVHNVHCTLTFENGALGSVITRLHSQVRILGRPKIDSTRCNDLQAIPRGTLLAGVRDGIRVAIEEARGDLYVTAGLDVCSEHLIVVGFYALERGVTRAFNYQASADWILAFL